MARPRSVLLVAAVLLAGAGCSEAGPDRTPGPSTLDAYATPVVAEVDVDADGFSESQLDLVAGDGVEVTNRADEELRVVGDVITATGDGEPRRNFDTGAMLPGETTLLAFTEEELVSFSILEVDGAALEVRVAPASEG